MFQIIDSITTTCLKYGTEYLPWIVAVFVVVAAGGIVLRVFKR